MIHFRDRKYGHHLNSSFFMSDNVNSIYDFSKFHKGDAVSIHWRITEKQYDAIKEMEYTGLKALRDSMTQDESRMYSVMLKLVVAERSHSFWPQRANLCNLVYAGEDVTLEAADGWWEDVLKWVLLNEAPPWYRPEDEEESVAGAGRGGSGHPLPGPAS
jgi:hypothetical protein